MKIIIFYSDDFGKKVLDFLINAPGSCTSCGEACTRCRIEKYSAASDIIDAIYVTNSGNPEERRTDVGSLLLRIKPADIALFLNVYTDTIFEIIPRLKEEGFKAIVVCSERAEDKFSNSIKQIEEKASEAKIEIAFAKPFCNIKQDSSKPTISEFLEKNRMGEPEINIKLQIDHGVKESISDVKVIRSTPCGSTWFIAKHLLGLDPAQSNFYDLAIKAHYTYPCSASANYDPEIGNTILHKAEEISRESIEKGIANSRQSESGIIDKKKCFIIYKKVREYFTQFKELAVLAVIISTMILLYATGFYNSIILISFLFAILYGYFFIGWAIKERGIFYPCTKINGLPNFISQVDKLKSKDIFYISIRLTIIISLCIILALIFGESTTLLYIVHSFMQYIAIIIFIYFLANWFYFITFIRKSISVTEYLQIIGSIAAIVTLITLFFPNPFGNSLAILLWGLDLKDPNPNVLNCVPGYIEQTDLEVNEGLIWRILETLSIPNTLELNHNPYASIYTGQKKLSYNKYRIDILVRETSNVPEKTSLSACIHSPLDLILSNTNYIELIPIPFNISFEPGGEIRTSRNATILWKLIGNIPKTGMTCLNITTKNNTDGISIIFNPPSIKTDHPNSDIVINIGQNITLGKHTAYIPHF